MKKQFSIQRFIKWTIIYILVFGLLVTLVEYLMGDGIDWMKVFWLTVMMGPAMALIDQLKKGSKE